MKYLFTIILFLFYFLGFNQKKPVLKPTRILFVFDASKSMIAKHDNTTRMDGAKNLFFKFIDSLSKDKTLQFALRMYGHTVKYPPGDCKDSKLIVPFGINNIALIKQKVQAATPTGITPIEHSLTESANDFKDNKTNNIVILITDGIEECGGDPCNARQKLMEKGIIFKPFIIGIGLTPEQIKTFECVGTFYDYDNQTTFNDISTIIQQQKLNKTSAQVNLLDTKSNPTETNVNMTFYDIGRKEYKYNYIHTLNYKNNPDTLYIDDYPTYKVIAHTIPQTESQEIKLSQGKHTIIPIDAPQGYLIIDRPNGVYNFNEKVKCVVRKTKDMNTINVQLLNNTEKYITGKYDVEILTLPRIHINNIDIEQSKTKTLEIPNAGVLQVKCLEAGDGCIMVKRNDKLEWVCNLSTQTLQTYYLQPGNYVSTWRAKTLKGSIYTIEKKFTITSDSQTTIEFYR
ncbi:MAG: VWA domain-containing protein [Bacteroidota bacterium]|nr:VWA domain-containing protein [Bacteroidota bacterium]MDP3144140.1 VWA domain-containing protein [Bacteroidota bacterium]